MAVNDNDDKIATGGSIATSAFGNNRNIGSGLLSLTETDLKIQKVQGSSQYEAPDTNRAFSGSDVIAFLVPKSKGATNAPYVPIKNLGAISYSIHRDKVPVRSLGTPRAKSYTLGTRTIAGSIVMVNFDRAALSELLYRNNYYGNNIQVNLYDEIPPFDVVLTFSNENSGKLFSYDPDTLAADITGDGVVNVNDNVARVDANLKKQLPKKYSALTLKNIRLIDEGMVTGVDEAFLETTFQYVAEDIEYLAPVTIG